MPVNDIWKGYLGVFWYNVDRSFSLVLLMSISHGAGIINGSPDVHWARISANGANVTPKGWNRLSKVWLMLSWTAFNWDDVFFE